MNTKERAFLDDLKAVCEKHGVYIQKYCYDDRIWFFDGKDVVIQITEDLLEE